MPLQLTKDQAPVLLSKSLGKAALTKITFGLAWNSGLMGKVDLDATIVVEKNGVVNPVSNNSMVGWPTLNRSASDIDGVNSMHSVKGVKHSGDCTTGETSDSDFDETIEINLSEVDGDKIYFIASSHVEGNEAPVMFSQAIEPRVGILDQNGQAVLEVPLDSGLGDGTCFVIGTLSKNGDDWEIAAQQENLGSTPQGIAELIGRFGIQL